MRSSTGASVARYTVLILLAVIFLIPFYILVRNAFSSQAGIAAANWAILPDNFGWENLRDLFGNPSVPVARSLVNSAVVAVLQTVGTLVISAMAGYGLARIENRAANLVLILTILTLM